MSDDFPYLDENQRIEFPSLQEVEVDGLLAAGGNLSPGVLLSAYENGIFPWYNPGDPILWWNPDPRFILHPGGLSISGRLRRSLRRAGFSFTMDKLFEQVIDHCSRVPRKGQEGTWITEEMKAGYIELHNLGWAHSLEVWQDHELAGGLYGLSIGGCFFGESMFSLVSGASKAAFILLAQVLFRKDFSFIDCQMSTPHLKALGGLEISRVEYMELLKSALGRKTITGSWDARFDLKLSL